MALNLLRVAAENVGTDRRTDGRNDKTTTVTLAAHAHRGLIMPEISRLPDAFSEYIETANILGEHAPRSSYAANV